MPQKTLNDVAQDRFKELKKKFHLNQISSVLTRSDREQIVNEATMKDSIDDVIKRTENKLTYDRNLHQSEINIAESRAKFVEDSFNFIESLELPTQLSLAIGLIISGHKTDNITDIGNAIQTLEDYIIGVGHEKKEGTKKTNS